MLRYKTETKPGLVALYDIRPGNGASQFLQPRSPHGASAFVNPLEEYCTSCQNASEQNRETDIQWYYSGRHYQLM